MSNFLVHSSEPIPKWLQECIAFYMKDRPCHIFYTPVILPQIQQTVNDNIQIRSENVTTETEIEAETTSNTSPIFETNPTLSADVSKFNQIFNTFHLTQQLDIISKIAYCCAKSIHLIQNKYGSKISLKSYDKDFLNNVITMQFLRENLTENNDKISKALFYLLSLLKKK